jgi:protease I
LDTITKTKFTMSEILKNRKIAILMTDGFEEVEFTKPREILQQEGADIEVISDKAGKVKAWNHTDWGGEYTVDKTLEEADSEDYDGLLLPGGVLNPDKLRQNQKAISFTKSFFQEGKPIAAICHGPQLLIETGAVTGRKMTSYPSIKKDLQNAGAHWVDQEVVVDKGLVTSRKPDDIPSFNKKMVEEFKERIHKEQKADIR